MPRPDRRRVVLLAVVVIVLTALAAAWAAGLFRDDSPESRLREATEGLRDRVRQLTH